jgi:hypothetical protein
VAVVTILSSSSAGRSSIEGASDAMVNADCVDTLEALDALGFLVFVDFVAVLLPSWALKRAKKAQSGERL